MKYWRRYVGDLQKKTVTLDPTEYGVYDLMMDYCYGTESALPLDLDEIHTICRCSKPEHFAAVQKILLRYWTRRDDGYHNERIDEELAFWMPVIEAQRASAETTNRKRQERAISKARRLGHRDAERGAEREIDAERDAERDGLPSQGPLQPSTFNLQPSTTNLQPLPSTKGNGKINGRDRAEARASRLPADWKLPLEWGAWAVRDRQWTAERTREVAAMFHDYWKSKSGKDARKLDWFATWRNWCRNEQRGRTLVGIVEQNRHAAEEWLGSERDAGD